MTDVGVRLGALTMNNTPDSDGDRFIIGSLDGIEAAKLDMDRNDHFGDGGVVNRYRLSKREITIHGFATGSGNYGALRTRQKIENAWAGLAAAIPQWVYFDFPSPGISFQVQGFPGGDLHLPAPKGNAQEFEMLIACEDPRKYSQQSYSATVGGSTPTTITNSGNYPTFAVATLTTFSVNPWLQNDTYNNARIAFPGNIASGLVVDFLKRQTIAAGAVTELAQLPRIWWPLLPGDNIVRGGGNWSLTWRSAWR